MAATDFSIQPATCDAERLMKIVPVPTQLEGRVRPGAEFRPPVSAQETDRLDALIEAEPFRSSFGRLRRRPPGYAACSLVMAATAYVTADFNALWIAIGLAAMAAAAIARTPGPESVVTYTSDAVALTAGVLFTGLDPLSGLALWSAITVVAFFGLSRGHARLVMVVAAVGIGLTFTLDRSWAVLELSARTRSSVSLALTAIGFLYLATVVPSLADATRQVLREAGASAESQRREAEFRAKLASMVAHELRNPLAGIKGFIDVLVSDDELSSDERSEYLAIVASQTASLEGIVEDLLVAVQSERGSVSVDEQPFDASGLVRRVVNELGPDEREAVIVEAVDEVIAIGDPTRVAQVIRNLLSNARKYGGPSVTVHCEHTPAGVRIAVSDDGSGIPPEDRSRVFQWFEGTARGSRGYGLGLPISRELAEAMGGSLVYEDRNGSTFVLTLRAV